MKPLHLALLVLVAAAVGVQVGRSPTGSAGGGVPARRIRLYQSPMHPWVTSDRPGKCTVCGMDLVPVYDEGETRAVERRTPGSVLLPPGSPAVLGVSTEIVRRRPFQRTLRLSGMIGEDESRHGVITAPVEGRVDGLAMSCEGETIVRRQPLVTLFSRTLLEAAADYRTALKSSPADAVVARRKLEQIGLVWEQIEAIPTRQEDDIHFGILAPLSGTIVKAYVNEGQQVKAGEKLFEIADFTRMWAMFTVYEQDLPWVQRGQIVEVRTPSLPGETLRSRVSFISPNLDDMSRSARVRVVLENPDRRIRNRIYAEGLLTVEIPDALTVPRGAVLASGGSPRVYVETASGDYRPRSVRLGRTGDRFIEVLEGLGEGERVVLSGAMLIDGQAQLEALAPPSGPNAAVSNQPVVLDASSSAKSPLGEYLSAVAMVQAALASDDLAAANAALKAVPEPPLNTVRVPVPEPAGDLARLRQSFLPWSVDVARAALELAPRPAGLRVFRCTMTGRLWEGAPSKAEWIQFDAAPRNPFWGAAMPDCGVEVSR